MLSSDDPAHFHFRRVSKKEIESKSKNDEVKNHLIYGIVLILK